MKYNSRSFYHFTDPRIPKGRFIWVGQFFLSSCPWISGDDYRTYITKRYSTVTRLWYRTFCCIASTLVMFNTPVFFLWMFIKRLRQLHCFWYSMCCSRDFISSCNRSLSPRPKLNPGTSLKRRGVGWLCKRPSRLFKNRQFWPGV